MPACVALIVTAVLLVGCTTDPPLPTTHVLQPGDTLAHVAEHYYGDPSKWVAIAEENPDANPMSLQVGQELKIPKLEHE